MRVFYSDTFVFPLPDRHHFPATKYRMLRERVESDPRAEMELAPVVTEADLLRVHDPAYVRAFESGALEGIDQKRIGFPWSPELVERTRRSCGATVAAARVALDEGVAVYLAGGTHHAYRDRGGGYCVYNDCAVGARVVQTEGCARVLIVDTDVHQGDGTASIFEGDTSVFTFSIHGARNYPVRKETSDLDVPLPDETGDEDYLAALEPALAQSFERARPDFVFFLSGADPFVGDKLGRLGLTKPGLAARDRRVLDACRDAGVPFVVVMGGGYAPDVTDSVDVYEQTVRQTLGTHG